MVTAALSCPGYLLIGSALLLVVCVCLVLIGLGRWARRDLRRRFDLLEDRPHRPEREVPCDFAGAIRDHVALADRHQEEAELGRVA